MHGPIRFGFLPFEGTIEFAAGKIVPVSAFYDNLKAIKKSLHRDGHLYPPIQKQQRTDVLRGNVTRTIPKTKRPAFLYRVPSSHEIYITSSFNEPNIRKGSAAFVLHFLAFIFGTRLQFSDWFVDGRIPVRDNAAASRVVIDPSDSGRLLDMAYRVWSRWPKPERTRFTNILYMYSRTSAYEWDWERFTIQYMILDACWKMAEHLWKLTSVPHEERIRVLCQELSVQLNIKDMDPKKIAALRNNLFHETLWHGGQPGGAGRQPFYFDIAMTDLNQRIILAIIEKSLQSHLSGVIGIDLL
jgi:hypothetical protein